MRTRVQSVPVDNCPLPPTPSYALTVTWRSSDGLTKLYDNGREVSSSSSSSSAPPRARVHACSRPARLPACPLHTWPLTTHPHPPHPPHPTPRNQVWSVTRGRGRTIPSGGTLVVGREQDCEGGCFDSDPGGWVGGGALGGWLGREGSARCTLPAAPAAPGVGPPLTPGLPPPPPTHPPTPHPPTHPGAAGDVQEDWDQEYGSQDFFGLIGKPACACVCGGGNGAGAADARSAARPA